MSKQSTADNDARRTRFVVLIAVVLGSVAAIGSYLGYRLVDHVSRRVVAIGERDSTERLAPTTATARELDPLLANHPDHLAITEIVRLGGDLDATLATKPGYIQITIGPEWKRGNDGLKVLQLMPRVHELTLDCANIDNQALQHLFHHKSSLQAVHLWRSQFSAQAIGELRTLPYLSLLDLDGPNATDDALAVIRDFDLMWLIIGAQSSVTDDGLKWVRFHPRLLSLRLSSPKVKGTAFRELACLDNLRELVLSGTRVDDDGLARLSGLDRLHTLDLSNTDIRGRTLGALSRLPRLRELVLDNTLVDDQAIPALSAVTGIEFLSLDGTRVTDSGLTGLGRLKSLRYLSLCRTATTSAAIESMQRRAGLAIFRDQDRAAPTVPQAGPK